jgi:uncharacterized protein HemX
MISITPKPDEPIPEKRELSSFAVGLLVVAALGVRIAIAAFIRDRQNNGAETVPEQQAKAAEVMQGQQTKDAEAQRQAAQEQYRHQQQVEAERAEQAREKLLPCAGDSTGAGT